MAEEVGVDLAEMGSGFVAMEEAEDSPLRLTACSAHGCRVELRITGVGEGREDGEFAGTVQGCIGVISQVVPPQSQPTNKRYKSPAKKGKPWKP
ncbi:hypothetical protein C1H46_029323 [Malus baccata]|uniref:Uncharacterized protein n=1 Tax=Malus baccata TaxID=106549 RepID=A0A540LFP2_MALBA|nr:hypothetical protein C1H46_029323 [Malus baccata]